MKRIYTIIFAAAALLTACEEFQPVFTGKYPEPQPEKIYTDADFKNIVSIAEIKDLYVPNKGPVLVKKNYVIKGQVTTSDQVGNLYKSLYIQDESAGIEIKIGKNGLYNEYKLGQWIYVDCANLTVGDYNGMINLGYEDPTEEYETAYLEHSYIINSHIYKGEYDTPVEPVEVQVADLGKSENLGRLVTIKNLKYGDHIFLLAYVDPNGNRRDNSNRIFIDEEGPDNYGVTTWACSEQKWKEYLYAGCFDDVEAPDGTVGMARVPFIQVKTNNIKTDEAVQEYIAGLPDEYRNAVNAGKIYMDVYDKLLKDYPDFVEKIGKTNLSQEIEGYKETVKDKISGEDKTVYHIGSMAYSVSQYFKMESTDVQVRSSGYARFADIEIPQAVLDGTASVTFTGILTEYKGEPQFTLIDLSGVKKADGSPWYDSDNKVIE